MTDYASNTHAEHLRLSILRLLHAQDGGLTANDSVLTDALPALGFRVPRDRVRTALAWLKEQELVTLETVGSLMVGTITRRGIEVAEGTARVPGVKRPAPQ